MVPYDLHLLFNGKYIKTILNVLVVTVSILHRANTYFI